MCIILIIIHLANITLHSCGLYLLRSLRRRQHTNRNQQLFIMNLSLVELLVSCIHLLIDVVTILPLDVIELHVQFQVHQYLEVIIYTMLSTVFYACMLYITVDKVSLRCHYLRPSHTTHTCKIMQTKSIRIL